MYFFKTKICQLLRKSFMKLPEDEERLKVVLWDIMAMDTEDVNTIPTIKELIGANYIVCVVSTIQSSQTMRQNFKEIDLDGGFFHFFDFGDLTGNWVRPLFQDWLEQRAIPPVCIGNFIFLKDLVGNITSSKIEIGDSKRSSNKINVEDVLSVIRKQLIEQDLLLTQSSNLKNAV